MLDKLREKAREVLVIFTAVAMLLSVALGVVGDAMLIGIIGFWGWYMATLERKK